MRLLPWLLVTLLLSIGGCDGGDNDNPSTFISTATEANATPGVSAPVNSQKIRLTGLVASANNFQGTVQGTNIHGQTAFAPINSVGVYLIDLPVGTPYLLRAIGSGDSSGQVLYSYMDTSDLNATPNITPLTTAAVQLAAAGNLEDLNAIFVNWNSQIITADRVNLAQKTVEEKCSLLFAQVGLDPAHVNIFTTRFERNDSALGWLMKRIIGAQYANGAVTLIAENGYPLLYPFNLEGNSLSFESGFITSPSTTVSNTGSTTNIIQECQLGTTRIGAICVDGSSSNSTGSGACSYHGGVSSWTCGVP